MALCLTGNLVSDCCRAYLDSGEFSYVGWDALGTVEICNDAAGPHIERVLRLVDPDVIRRRKFKVVLDVNRGSGAVAARANHWRRLAAKSLCWWPNAGRPV